MYHVLRMTLFITQAAAKNPKLGTWQIMQLSQTWDEKEMLFHGENVNPKI